MTTKPGHVLTLVVALVAGFLAWQQWDRQRALRKQIDSLTAEAAKKEASIQEKAVLLARLEEENDVFSKEVASLRRKATPAQRQSSAGDDPGASPAADENGLTKVFRRMSEDPKLKEIGNQWRANRVKRIYGDFVKARQLNPEQAKQFFDLLAKEENRKRDEESSLYAGDENDASAKQNQEQFANQKADIERQLKLLLGDKDYAAFEEYKTTTRLRSALLEVHERLARNNLPLSAEQADALLQVMLEEGSPQVLDRTETILTPEQRKELERFQDEQAEIARARLEAVSEMTNRNKRTDLSPSVSPPSP